MKAAEQDRPDVAAARAWSRVQQTGLAPDKLVFIDETWAATNMIRPRGRALVGTRRVDKTPHGRWKTTTLIAGLRADGLTAPLVVDGAVNGYLFVSYVEQTLAPALRLGDVVVMDNLSSHKRRSVRQAIEAVGAKLLYLQPYSPDFNPIEQAFSKFKRLLQTTKTRTVDALWKACGDLLERFSQTECRQYIRHAGYRYV